MKFKVSAILPIPAEVYFVERDSSAFRSLVCEMCKLESMEVGESWLEGDTEVYEFVTKPDIHKYVPHKFKHFIPGGDLHYTDVIAYDPKCIASSPYRMRVQSVPPIFSGKAQIDSELIIEEVTPETCRQTLEGTVEIKVIGLGHVTEKIIVDNLRGVYKGVPKIVERWVKFRNEVLKQPGGREVLVEGRPKNTKVDWINDQIRALIKAEDTESETSDSRSTASGHDSSRQDQLPTVEEMMQQCSIQDRSSNGSATHTDSDDDEEIFFDARENPTFMNLNNSVQRSLQPISSLDRRMSADQRDAAKLVSDYQKAGHRVKRMEVDPSPPSVTTDQASRLESQRFAADYNTQLQEWREFWKEHEVPEAKHVKNQDFRKRLGHVFGIGADAGMFKHSTEEQSKKTREKKKRQRFHLRRKHRQPVEYEDRSHQSEGNNLSQESHDTSASSTSAAAKVCLKDTDRAHRKPLEEGKEQKSLEKGHQRSRSGGFLKDLFTRHKGHESSHNKGEN